MKTNVAIATLAATALSVPAWAQADTYVEVYPHDTYDTQFESSATQTTVTSVPRYHVVRGRTASSSDDEPFDTISEGFEDLGDEMGDAFGVIPEAFDDAF